jgi:SPP1 gp7 family putative phage head morphogenesis protein
MTSEISEFIPEISKEFIKKSVDDVHESLINNLLKKFNKELSDGVSQGMTDKQLAKTLRDKWDDFKSKTSSIITARTILHAVYNRGALQDMIDLPGLIGFEFSAIIDSRTTDICQHLDGKIIKKEDIYKYTPPLHWGCRSTLIPIFDTETISDAKYLNENSETYKKYIQKNLNTDFYDYTHKDMKKWQEEIEAKQVPTLKEQGIEPEAKITGRQLRAVGEAITKAVSKEVNKFPDNMRIDVVKEIAVRKLPPVVVETIQDVLLTKAIEYEKQTPVLKEFEKPAVKVDIAEILRTIPNGRDAVNDKLERYDVLHLLSESKKMVDNLIRKENYESFKDFIVELKIYKDKEISNSRLLNEELTASFEKIGKKLFGIKDSDYLIYSELRDKLNRAMKAFEESGQKDYKLISNPYLRNDIIDYFGYLNQFNKKIESGIYKTSDLDLKFMKDAFGVIANDLMQTDKKGYQDFLDSVTKLDKYKSGNVLKEILTDFYIPHFIKKFSEFVPGSKEFYNKFNEKLKSQDDKFFNDDFDKVIEKIKLMLFTSTKNVDSANIEISKVVESDMQNLVKDLLKTDKYKNIKVDDLAIVKIHITKNKKTLKEFDDWYNKIKSILDTNSITKDEYKLIYSFTKSAFYANGIYMLLATHNYSTDIARDYFLSDKRKTKKYSKVSDDTIANVQQLNAVLNKLPDYVGNVYRKMWIYDQKLLKQLSNKGEIIDKFSLTYNSSSKNSDFSWYHNVKLLIKSKHGKYIGDIPAPEFLKQQEVIFKVGSKFKTNGIIGQVDDPDTFRKIDVYEIEEID